MGRSEGASALYFPAPTAGGQLDTLLRAYLETAKTRITARYKFYTRAPSKIKTGRLYPERAKSGDLQQKIEHALVKIAHSMLSYKYPRRVSLYSNAPTGLTDIRKFHRPDFLHMRPGWARPK